MTENNNQSVVIKGIAQEDFNHYKTCSMVIAFPTCSFKCGEGVCHNSPLTLQKNQKISVQSIISQYLDNHLTHALVFAGLEPFDSFSELMRLILRFREQCQDPIIIYTGYTEEEIEWQVHYLSNFTNIIVKFGRFKPNHEPHFDELLGIKLWSDNQYAKEISK